MSEIIWDIMEMEAVERYYLDRPQENFRAKKPAIIITTGMFKAPNAKNRDRCTVWFGQGLGYWNFKSFSKAREKVREIVSKSQTETPIRIRIERRGEN